MPSNNNVDSLPLPYYVIPLQTVCVDREGGEVYWAVMVRLLLVRITTVYTALHTVLYCKHTLHTLNTNVVYTAHCTIQYAHYIFTVWKIIFILNAVLYCTYILYTMYTNAVDKTHSTIFKAKYSKVYHCIYCSAHCTILYTIYAHNCILHCTHYLYTVNHNSFYCKF